MSTPESEESTVTAAARALQGLVLERLAVGMVVIALALIVYGAVEGGGAARVFAVTVGVLGVVMPLAGWRLHWSDAVMWLVLLPLTLGILVAFSWASRG
ncbi:hypothetical protein [Nocardioides houyundeii]|uniref:hypothetical protein n=1 Tax=Nocardioides houyundeii TaxID=2045452 RepID=UPI000DF18C66|nr:hypothetical protein [Nocardioides houyundeii]